MQTNLANFISNTADGKEANSILRACVHCGFCNATCPTYQLLGDELDGPRGRIYLIKQVLEGHRATRRTQKHLDRCLTCRACETTCPSGVEYGRLVDIGRGIVEKQVNRSLFEKIKRWLLRRILPFPKRVALIFRLGQLLYVVLPDCMARKIPVKRKSSFWPKSTHQRKMLVLDGCVQAAAARNINASTARILHRLGISLISVAETGCCGAVSYHLSAYDESLHFMRKNIDAWWPYIEKGAEAIVMTASGCGVMVKDYQELLKNDPHYAVKAARVSEMSKDISEIISHENFESLGQVKARRVAFQSPCSLQHGMKLNGSVEHIMTQLGFNLVNVMDPHLCCGSAGTYSILQHNLSERLLKNKISALEKESPGIIATANIGCLIHLQSATTLPVRHWIEVLDQSLPVKE